MGYNPGRRMSQLFQRKPIAALIADIEHSGLKRVMGAGDLIMLAIGAVIGAGIFSSIGTAAAGEVLPSGEVVRYGAGPALVVSFALLAVVCGLAALCYAELAAMIPQAGSAYAYSYATLGELIAWIIGWDLILEYAVGNIAVAIAWSGYFTSLLTVFGIHLPDFLTHGYRTALLSSDPAIHALLQSAPQVAGVPLLLNIPAFAIVMLITWLLYVGVKESVRANNIMVVVKLLVLGLFVTVGIVHVNPDNFVPFAPNGWRGIHQGAAIVFFAYIGFDAISTAAEETKNPQRNMPLGILGGLAICTVIYIVVGVVATGLVPYQQLRAADPLAHALETGRPADRRSHCRVRRDCIDHGCAPGLPVRTAADLLRHGSRRPASQVGRENPSEVPNAACHDRRDRSRRRGRRAVHGRERDLRPDQYRDPVGIRDCLPRRPGAAAHRSRSPAAVPRPGASGCCAARRGRLSVRDPRSAGNRQMAFSGLARRGHRAVFRLRVPPQSPPCLRRRPILGSLAAGRAIRLAC